MPATTGITRRTWGYIVGAVVALVLIVLGVLLFQLVQPQSVPSPDPVPSADDDTLLETPVL
ncbi:MAG TPA: hypothetical protein VGN60_10415 [Devosia sp.]|jgi:hypothetical protein|nr:hypothetical protein [Devosia sp.]